MKSFREFYTEQDHKLIQDIVRSEMLDNYVYVTVEKDTLGDTVIIIEGSTEAVDTIKDIYRMVKGE